MARQTSDRLDNGGAYVWSQIETQRLMFSVCNRTTQVVVYHDDRSNVEVVRVNVILMVVHFLPGLNCPSWISIPVGTFSLLPVRQLRQFAKC